jgi:hypothetical protein
MMMLSCKQVSKLVSQSLDRSLTWSDKIQLRLHLLMCNPCTQFKRQLHMLRTALQRIRTGLEHDSSIKLPLEVKNRILHRIESDQ